MNFFLNLLLKITVKNIVVQLYILSHNKRINVHKTFITKKDIFYNFYYISNRIQIKKERVKPPQKKQKKISIVYKKIGKGIKEKEK